nr:AAA family ATPase [Actinomycetota bacterium]
MREWTGRQVASKDFGPLEWLDFVGRPCIVRGTATLISAYPKVGKTKALRSSVENWRRAGTTILFLTEEGERAWHERLRDAGEEWADVSFVETMNQAPAELLTRTINGPEDIVVVDTARHAFGMRDENDNAEVARRSAPWIAGARTAGKTLVVSVHENKAGGEHGRGISGGHALFGAFDAAVRGSADQHPDARPGARLGALVRPCGVSLRAPGRRFPGRHRGRLSGRTLGGPADGCRPADG